jgi:membrane protease YdiL (CAAX protease family)
MAILDANDATEEREGASAGEKLSESVDGAEASAAETAAEVIPQQGLVRSIVLHLVPGAIATAIYVGLVPFAERAGYPPLAAMIVGIVAGAIPFELGMVLLEGERRNGRWSFDGVIFNREAWPAARYFKVVPIIVLLCIVGYGLGLPLDRVWHRVAFAWLPGWFVFSGVKQYAGYGRGVLLMVFAGRLIFDALVIPVVEEIYFRGYLLPRISRFGGWAVWINCGLFSIYHFWSPYGLPTIFLASLPVVVVAWMTGNYRVGMLARIVVGIIGGMLAISGVLHLAR